MAAFAVPLALGVSISASGLQQKDDFPPAQPFESFSLDESDTQSFPARTVVKVLAQVSDHAQTECLGVLTRKRTVRTVAHCLEGPNHTLVESAKLRVEVWPALGRALGRTSFKVLRYRTQDSYNVLDFSTNNFEAAILEVEEDIGDKLGWFSIYDYTDGTIGTLPPGRDRIQLECQSNLRPPYVGDGNPLNALLRLLVHNNLLISVETPKQLKICMFSQRAERVSFDRCGLVGVLGNRFLISSCPGMRGDSGAPIFYVENGLPVLLGLHSYAKREQPTLGLFNHAGAVFLTGQRPPYRPDWVKRKH